MTTKAEKRRQWMNKELARRSTGISMSQRKKNKLMKKVWKEAKKKYP